ncbi:MAG: sensor histidine kinase [Chloroflexaceae bacterium]|nr:sensor histidine kinase [Chloroflexaceae bacterium]
MDAAAGDYNEALLAGFSNSIRGPLHSLRELIARVPAAGQLNEQQSVLIGQVVQLNTELTMLVNDLLTLGQVRYQMAEMSGALRLDLLVEAAIGTRYAEFGRRGQRVELGVDADLPRVIGSDEGLGRVIGELLDNVILYTPPGSQIAVQVVQQDDQVLVTVEDNGPGLEPEEAAQVFEPFYRAPLAEQLGVEGRGLGLTIARAVIEHHRGRIWVESVAGQGCRFAFSLPSDPESG